MAVMDVKTSRSLVGYRGPSVPVILNPYEYTGSMILNLDIVVYEGMIWEEIEGSGIQEADRASVTGFDEQTLAKLYAEFAEENRQLAEMGLADYMGLLEHEDRE